MIHFKAFIHKHFFGWDFFNIQKANYFRSMEKKYKETKLQTCDISVVSKCTFHTIEKKNTFWDRYCKNRIFLHYSLVYQFLQFLKAIKIQEIFATTKEKKIPLKIPDIKCFVLKPGYKKSIKHLTHYWPSTFHHICCYPNITGFVKIYIFFFTVTH